MLDLTEVTYVKRVVVGSTNPELVRHPQEIQQALDLVNRCLTDSPRGKLIGVEKSFALLNINEHQVVLQAMIYHIGFVRRPAWLD